MCQGVPPVREGQHFSTNVRVKDTKFLTIPNKTNQAWHLKPIIEGEQWSGPVSFTVDPQQTKQYELTYHPVTMTSEGKKHTVSGLRQDVILPLIHFPHTTILLQMTLK